MHFPHILRNYICDAKNVICIVFSSQLFQWMLNTKRFQEFKTDLFARTIVRDHRKPNPNANNRKRGLDILKKGSSINDFMQFWTISGPPPQIVTYFISNALVMSSQYPWPHTPKTVTSFMDEPVDKSQTTKERERVCVFYTHTQILRVNTK